MSSTPAAPPRGKRFDICSVGNMCIDIMLPISEYPIIRQQHQRLTSGAWLEVGGSLNALLSASRLGARTAAISFRQSDDLASSGSDALMSKFFIEIAERNGISTKGMIQHPDWKLPTCAGLYDPSGTHTFLASNEQPMKGSENLCDELPREMREVVHESRAMIVDGYAFHSDRQIVHECVTEGVRTGCEVWLDPQAATTSLRERKDNLFEYLLDVCSGISLTLEEAVILTGTDNPAEVIRKVADMCSSVQTILLKDGSNGSHCGQRKSGWETFSTPAGGIGKRFEDSIGAGDSFLGAFLAGSLSRGLGIEECCILANAMGAATCSRHGGGVDGIGTLADVIAGLGESGAHNRVREALRSTSIAA